MLKKENISSWFQELQNDICNALEEIDGSGKFISDKWDREKGGGGDTRVIQDGSVFEKGGVNFSAVHGETPAKILEALRLPKSDFYATGVSIVIHPKSPLVPIIHMNVRYFEMSTGTYWFGGGIDLTPIYVDKEDSTFFHQKLKVVCDKHNADYYEKFKKWADDYFYIKHRDETRGIGGIFFDRLSSDNPDQKEVIFKFVQDVGKTFSTVYKHIVDRHKGKAWTDDQKSWQKIRRGRYVEFNLVYDKGTKFGLDTDGRTESILMSLPKEANWLYNHQPNSGSEEALTLSYLKKGINWID